MKEFLDRFNSPTPAFWKKIRSRSLIMFGLFAALSTGNIDVNGQSLVFELPEQVQTVLNYLMTASGVVWFISNFAVDGGVKSE